MTWPVLNKMAAIHALSAYGDSDSDENESVEEEITPDHTAHLNSDVSISKLQSKIQLKSAPEVTAKVDGTISRLAYMYIERYNLGQNRMEQQTPIPPKSRMKSPPKTRYFPILDLAGRGGLGFPFILSKVVSKLSKSRNSGHC